MLETILQLATSWILPGLFFWAVLSLLASAILEWISFILNWKAQYMEQGIGEMLGDDNLARDFLEHPLIVASSAIKMRRGQRSRYKKIPQQIPSRIFAQIILDWVLTVSKPGEDEVYTPSLLKKNLMGLKKQYPDLGQALNVMFASAGIDRVGMQVDELLLKIQQHIQNWFDDSMGEVTNWYKRRAQIYAVVIGVILAVMVNFDVIGMTTRLWTSASQGPVIQKAIEEMAKQVNSSDNVAAQDYSFSQAVNLINSKLNALPILWIEANIPSTLGDWISKIMGLFAGGGMIALGAQYGYDLLSKKK